jgi:hypothetical protein
MELVLWCLLLGALVALVLGARRRAATAAAVVIVALLLVARAETPFGIGNGTVPRVVGLDECSATDKLAARDLRWRFGPRAPIGGRPASCIDGGPFSVADDVVGQRPAPGTRLQKSAVVTLETPCTRERRCSRLGRYAHGVPSR